jgi:hypothetical protein
MPGAVSRRLRHLGRYLWIQPGGLDLAAALPGGRLRYRSLGDISSYYSEVLAWADDVAPHLPWGWRESVRYLSDLIARHRVADVWQAGNDARARKPRDDLWQHLLGLLRNGAPVMMVADQTLRCRPLRGTKSSAKEFLSSVDGCGKILERVRLTRHIRMWRSFRPTVDADAAPILEELNRYADALAALRSHHGPNLPDRLAAVARQMQTFYEKLIETPTDDREGARERFAAALSSCLGDDEQNYRSDDWYPEGILRFSGAPFARTASILGTRLDYVWLAMDAIGAVAASFYRYRYFDGYHSLAVINDLRNEFKDTTPRVDLATISQVIDLYVSGIQGIVAHLAWCLTMLGHQKRAARIMPPNLQFVPPPDFSPPQPDELGALVQVVEQSDAEYGVFVRGIPGKGIASDLCFHSPARGVLKLSDFTARAPRRHAAAEPAEADAVPDTPGA